MLRDLVLLVALGQQPCVWAMGYISQEREAGIKQRGTTTTGRVSSAPPWEAAEAHWSFVEGDSGHHFQN